MSKLNKRSYQAKNAQGAIAFKRRMFVFFHRVNSLIKFLLFFFVILFFSTNIFLEHKIKITNYIKRICINEHVVLQNVYIRGRQNAKISNLLNIIKQYDGQALPLINLHDFREELLKDPFVSDVVVSRKFPHDISIAIIETRPIAVWKKNNKSYLINSAGDIIDHSVEKFVHLPVIMGEGANLYFYFLVQKMDKYPKLKKDILAASFVGRRRWDIYFIDNIIVNLPENNIEQAFNDLISIFAQHSRKSLNNKVIDLRDGKKYYVK